MAFIAAIALVIFLVGCGGGDEEAAEEPGTWVEAELTDIETGETFTIAELAGQPVFIESFAVWCPTCSSQLLEMRELLGERDDVRLVALDTDPNEDRAKVLEHIERNGFVGRFAIAPQEMTNSLVDQFGPEIVAVPTAPVVLLSADQESARLLERGVKDAEELEAALEEMG